MPLRRLTALCRLYFLRLFAANALVLAFLLVAFVLVLFISGPAHAEAVWTNTWFYVLAWPVALWIAWRFFKP